jgi:hypothetical protein
MRKVLKPASRKNYSLISSALTSAEYIGTNVERRVYWPCVVGSQNTRDIAVAEFCPRFVDYILISKWVGSS